LIISEKGPEGKRDPIIVFGTSLSESEGGGIRN